jgi:hypothetical protein
MKPMHFRVSQRALFVLLPFFYCQALIAQNWSYVSGIKAQDISVGKNGSVWAIATNGNIYRWDGSSWQAIPGGASRIAVDPSGNPWVVNSDGNIYKYTTSNNQWEMKPGLATDIGIGGDGSVWVIGRNKSGNDYDIYKWNGSNWSNIAGGAVRIAVDPWGNPWVVNSTGNVFHYNGSTWDLKPGSVKDVAVGANGSVWCTGTDLNIYQWDGSNWAMQTGGASQISVTPDGNAWVVNGAGEVFHSLDAVSALKIRTIFPRRGIYEYKILQAIKYGNLASQVFMGGGSGNFNMLDDLGKAFGTYALNAAEMLFATDANITPDQVIGKAVYDNATRTGLNGILCLLIVNSILSRQVDPAISFESRMAMRSWCENLFWSIKVRCAKAILDEYQKWKADPCSYQAEGYKAPPDCALKGFNFTQWYGTRKPPEDILGKAGLKSVLTNNADAVASTVALALAAVTLTAAAGTLSVSLVTANLFAAFGVAAGEFVGAAAAAGGAVLGAAGWGSVAAAPIAAAVLSIVVGTMEGFRVVEAVKVEPTLKMKLGAAMSEPININNVMADSNSRGMFFVAFQEAALKNFQIPDTRVDGEVRFYCQAGFVSSFRLTYDLNGQTQTFTTPDLSVGYEKTFSIPYNAKNIHVQGWYALGGWKDLFNQTLLRPTFICYTSYGTIAQPSYKTDCPEVGNMTTKPNELTVTQGGGYSAWVRLTYVQNGQQITALDQSSVASGWRKVFSIPVGVTNIHLQIWDATGLSWEPWKTVVDKTWPTPPNECIKVYGTTLDPKWDSECN